MLEVVFTFETVRVVAPDTQGSRLEEFWSTVRDTETGLKVGLRSVLVTFDAVRRVSAGGTMVEVTVRRKWSYGKCEVRFETEDFAVRSE